MENILEPVRRACTIGGTEIAVMPCFELKTLLAPEAYCAPEDWTVWKFLELNQTSRMFADQSPSSILHYCMGIRYGEYFVDWGKKESHFDGDEFRRVLEACNTKERDKGSGRFEDGDELFYEVFISSPWDIVSDSDENYSAKLIGYPGWNGGEYKLYDTIGMYAINSASENKEGAWDFLEYLLSDQFQSKVKWCFPVIKSHYETCLTDLYITPSRLLNSWFLGDPAIPTEADIARLKEMVDSAICSSWGGWTNPIWNVVTEEASMYFAGDATLDDTVAKIQNRMQLILQE